VSRNLDAEIALDIVKEAFLALASPGSGQVLSYFRIVSDLRRRLRRDRELAAAVIALDATGDSERAQWIIKLINDRLAA
jgi:hypothetical protein